MEKRAVKDIMSIIELSEYLGLSRSKIYQLIRQKKIPASKIGRQYKFSKDVIDSWMKESIIRENVDIQMKLPMEKKSTQDKIGQQGANKSEEVKKNGKEESKEESNEEKKEVG